MKGMLAKVLDVVGLEQHDGLHNLSFLGMAYYGRYAGGLTRNVFRHSGEWSRDSEPLSAMTKLFKELLYGFTTSVAKPRKG